MWNTQPRAPASSDVGIYTLYEFQLETGTKLQGDCLLLQSCVLGMSDSRWRHKVFVIKYDYLKEIPDSFIENNRTNLQIQWKGIKIYKH